MTTAQEAWEAYIVEQIIVRRTDYAPFMAGWDAAMRDRAEGVGVAHVTVIPSRTADPATSHAAAREIKVRAGSQRGYLLVSFARKDVLDGGGLTDEEAMVVSAFVHQSSEYSKRCSELREAGYIEPTGETRTGSSGLQRIVSRITEKGRAAVKEL